MSTIIKESLKNAQTYTEYRDLVAKLTEENSTTGKEKTENLIEFTKLNDRRMKRWDKTLNIPQDLQERIKAFENKVTWLVITESWCGDAAHIMPVINKVAEVNDNITFKAVLRDDNDSLMDEFLTNGSRSIPKIIMLDDTTEEVIGTFGPRPKVATQLVNDFKEAHGKLTPEFKQDLQVWYNKDKGQSVMKDLTEMLCQLEPATCL